MHYALRTYRQTPHPATDIPPANMLFRDGFKTHFPKKSSSEIDVQESRKTDHESKVATQWQINKGLTLQSTENNHQLVQGTSS